MASLAQINIRFKADLSGFSSDMQKSMRQLQKVGSQMNAIGKSMSTYITLPLLAAGGAAIKFASDYNESLNKVEVAFGSSSESVKNFAKDSLESFGIAEGSALDAAAQYGDMATSMGINQQAAAKMSTSLVGLAGDLASFKNIGIDQANTALAGVFTGETESLKKLGIVMTEANLQQFALSKGIKVQVKDMDQASKVNLRYAYIMANTTNAQGDFARTGGGAANQSRIFTESLKQLGQQFGSIILPFFTKAITYVNGIIKGFSELSTETKGVIVVVAAVAVAIGPLMVGLGNIIGIIPRLIVQFKALQLAIVSNPYTAAALAIGVLGVALFSYLSTTKTAVKEISTLNRVNDEAAKLIEKQKAQLNLLLETARNENLSKKERYEAIKKINDISPKYLGNITLEQINTDSATKAIERYNTALLKGAKAKAALNLLVSLSEKELAVEIQNEKAKRASAEALANIKNKTADNILLQNQQNALYKDENGLRAALTKGQKEKLDQEKKTLTEIYNANKQFIDLIFDETDALGDVKTGLDAIKNSVDALTPGTIAFYEAQISGFQKLQKEQAITNSAWLQYQNNIDVIQKKIDALTSTNVKLPKPTIDTTDDTVPTFGLQELKNQKAYFENLREMYATNSDEYAKMTEQINNTDIKIKGIEGFDEIKNGFDIVKQSTEDFMASQQRLSETAQLVGQGVADAFNSMAGRLVESWGLADTGFQGFVKGLAQTAIKLISMLLAESVALAIKGASISAAFSGPGAVFAQPAFIATAVSGVLAAFAAIPKFETGGIVGGTSYYGDKLFARVNSGEMILNKTQQRNLSNMINPAVTAGDVAIQLMGGFEIEGTKLRLVLDRTDKKKNRLG